MSGTRGTMFALSIDDALGNADEQGNGATNYAARWQYGLTPLPHRRLQLTLTIFIAVKDTICPVGICVRAAGARWIRGQGIVGSENPAEVGETAV